jgi:hypothetical protein
MIKYLPIVLCLLLGIVFWLVAGLTYGGIFLAGGLIWAVITLSSAELKRS